MKKIIKLTESELVLIIKKVISEQPITGLGRAIPTRIQKTSNWSGKTPRVEDGSPSPIECDNPTPYEMQVKGYFTYCNKNKSKYSGGLTPTQRYLIQDLYKSMEGLFSTGTLSLIEKISTLDDFCKVAVNYNYENSERPGKNDLYSWLDDETSIQWIDVASALEKFKDEAGVSTCLDGIDVGMI
jgi:hypothetical protein